MDGRPSPTKTVSVDVTELDNGRAVGLVGLGTMGRGLAEALARAGLTVEAVEPLGGDVAPLDGVTLRDDLAALVKNLPTPRRVLLMVTAGDPVDAVIETLAPLLKPGDIVIDGGNSHFHDTERRGATLAERGVHYLGVGISGGEKGARDGASIMAGGPAEAYAACRDILEALAARDGDAVCCAHLGPGGAGHFVKMVHNGIEYAAMQAIGEAWHLLRRGCGLDNAAIAGIFRHWNEGALASYLMSIAATVLETTDAETGQPMIEVIADAAAQTGTGRWLVTEAMDLGVPVPTIAEAVAARSLSAMAEVRVAVAAGGLMPAKISPDDTFVAAVGDALFASIVAAYAQGFVVIRAASARYGWPMSEEVVATIWRKGCIIQSRFLENVAAAYRRRPDLPVLLLDDAIRAQVSDAADGWRNIVAAAAQSGVPVPAMASALSWYDAIRSDRLWTALTQAQRDLFGAHTYARTDRSGKFHTDWPEVE